MKWKLCVEKGFMSLTGCRQEHPELYADDIPQVLTDNTSGSFYTYLVSARQVCLKIAYPTWWCRCQVVEEASFPDPMW